jgi:hypothetical protein
LSLAVVRDLRDVRSPAGPDVPSSRTNACAFQRTWLSSDFSVVTARPRLPQSRRTSSTVSAFCISHTSRSSDIHHLAPFALQAALPLSLAGRYPCDYYGASVALGLAPRRRSHVRP